MKVNFRIALSALGCIALVSCSSVVRPPKAISATQPDVQTRLLKQAVNENSLVDYQGLQTSPALINQAYAEIAQRSPDSHPQDFATEDERFAYWLNAYNIATIYAVTQIYPIDSVRDHKPLSALSLINGGGFFAAQKFVFGGKAMSLHALENQLIRKRFSDPRLHFALNCASIGCPDLARVPYRASILNEQLEHQTIAFINSDKGMQIDDAAREIRLSSIFTWYAEDFVDGKKTAIDYVAKYYKNKKRLAAARQKGYTVTFLDYDWGLNEQKKEG